MKATKVMELYGDTAYSKCAEKLAVTVIDDDREKIPSALRMELLEFNLMPGEIRQLPFRFHFPYSSIRCRLKCCCSILLCIFRFPTRTPGLGLETCDDAPCTRASVSKCCTFVIQKRSCHGTLVLLSLASWPVTKYLWKSTWKEQDLFWHGVLEASILGYLPQLPLSL